MVSTNNEQIIHTMARSTLFSRNHSTFFSIRREDQQMPPEVYCQKSCNIHEKIHVLKSLLNNEIKKFSFYKEILQAVRPETLLKRTLLNSGFLCSSLTVPSYKSKPMFNRYFKPMFNRCLTNI